MFVFVRSSLAQTKDVSDSKQLDDQPKKEPAVVASWGQCLRSSEAVAPASAGFQRHHRKLLPSWWRSPNPGNGKQSLSMRLLFSFLADSVNHQMLSHVHIAWLSKPSSSSLGCQPASASLQSVLPLTYPNLETAVWSESELLHQDHVLSAWLIARAHLLLSSEFDKSLRVDRNFKDTGSR